MAWIRNCGICPYLTIKAVVVQCVVVGSAILLSGCAHDGASLDAIPQPIPAADPRICADIPQEPPIRGALVQPVTPEEQVGFEEFANGEWAARAWGRLGWRVVRTAQQQYCR